MEAKEILKSFAEGLGFDLVPKEKDQAKPVNVSKYPEDIDKLMEEIKKLNQQIALEKEFSKQARNSIIEQWNKEGANEFNKLVFDAGRVMPNRLIIVNTKEMEKERLVSALEEKLKNLLIRKSIDSLDKKIANRIKSMEPVQQSFGTGIKVTI